MKRKTKKSSNNSIKHNETSPFTAINSNQENEIYSKYKNASPIYILIIIYEFIA